MQPVLALAAGFIGLSAFLVAAESHEMMPVAQQNALVQKYCAVCHTDAARNGGLSLERFDAYHVDPSLAAMLVSKLKGGAMGAAGVPVPDKSTTGAFISALTSEAAGSHEWTVKRTEDTPAKQPVLTASIARALPSARSGGEPALYRLVLACNLASHQGGMQLSWSPEPKAGTLSVSSDGGTPVKYEVEGTERMGNGTPGGAAAPAAITLYETAQASRREPVTPKLALPLRTLTISDLFPDETVSFPFDALTEQARQEFAMCFSESGPGR